MGIVNATWVRLSLTLALSVGGALLAQAGQGASEDDAEDLLGRALARSRSVTMTAIIVERRTLTGCETVLKVEQERNGRSKITILQPLNLQGVVSLDDGKRWWNYHPDEARMIVQDSPRLRRDDARFRMNLASRNYVFSRGRASAIAGRPVVVIQAAPRTPELPIRRYFVDARHNILLRLELVDAVSGSRQTVMDTRAIQFPDQLPPGALDMQPVESVRTIQLPSPVRVDRNADLRDRLGFTPVLPNQLPFGFVLREPELTGERDNPMIAVRITDGLVSATVYQWDMRKMRGPGPRPASNEREMLGLRIRIVGELPPRVQERILERFLHEGARTQHWDPELRWDPGTLKDAYLPGQSGTNGTVDVKAPPTPVQPR